MYSSQFFRLEKLTTKLYFSEIFGKKPSTYGRINRFHLRNFAKQPELAPFSEEDTSEFMSYFPLVVKDLTEEQQLTDIQEVTERFADCLNYNVPNGKRVRGLTAVITYKYLEKPENLTTQNIKLANILGWCIELVGAALLIYDDITDNSVTRRNSMCWHRKEGLIAIEDAIAIHSSAYILLRKYLEWHPFYMQMCGLSNKVLYYTAFGQTMDSFIYQPKEISMEKCKTIHKYKTGFYTFYCPVILGMYLSKTYNQDIDNDVKPILFDLGELFQVNNDVHDCFADVTVTGKYGSDIEESKCTWLAARTLEKCSVSQRKFFEEHYGKPGKQAVDNIRNLYLELNVLNDYLEYEKEFYRSLLDRAGCLRGPQKDLIVVLIEKLQNQMRRYGKNLINPSKLG